MNAERLTVAEAVDLLRHAEAADLMDRADQVRRRLHGRRTYFVHSLNLNPTNICENQCRLCAFWRAADAPDAYVMSLDDARQRLLAAKSANLSDLHIVGGLAPQLDLAYYESLLRLAGELLPGVMVQGMTAVEVDYLARREKLSVAEVLARLRAAGLGAIPGGGAEIFDPAVRGRICENKIPAERWLAVHEQAHALGLPSNATMLFGHVESPEAVVDHLDRLRQLQDRTGGLRAFVALPFHAEGTRLDATGPGGHTIARVVALARLFLDNVPHVRVLANYVDRKLLQVLTHAGADDVGGTSLDERIARAAGAPEDHRIATVAEMEEFLRDLGLEGILVNSRYEAVGGPVGAAPCGRPAFEVTVGPCAGAQNLNNGRAATWGRPYERQLPETAGAPGDRLRAALEAAESGRRLSAADALVLHEEAPLGRIGLLAHRRRLTVVPQRRVTFVLDRNISLTNVCEADCLFCAFHVEPGSDRAFVLTLEEIVGKVDEAVRLGATQIMLQGGLNPALGLEFYEEALAALKRRGNVWIHSLSPAEVLYLAGKSGLPVRDCLRRLQAAGLDSLPGGGAEILVDRVRRSVSPRKIGADDWFAVMEAAHELGLKATATMVYGLGESAEERIEHLVRVREFQDRTGVFTAFIPWSFQPRRTRIALRPKTGVDYLRVVALARLVLDNVPHLQAGWVTEGPDVAQLALSFGADDWGGVLMEERVVRATGVSYAVTRDDVLRLIRETGMTPAQRTTQYEVLRVFDE